MKSNLLYLGVQSINCFNLLISDTNICASPVRLGPFIIFILFPQIRFAMSNTSLSQNVGLIAMTGIMSRQVVTIGALFLITCGLIPKVGGLIGSMPIEVLGGGVIVMFGMVVAAGVSILSDVNWNRRNMVIFAIALSIGLGLQLEPSAIASLPDTPRILLASGMLPAALIAITLNLALPAELSEESAEKLLSVVVSYTDG